MCLESGGNIYSIMQSSYKKVRALYRLCIKWVMLFPVMHECVIFLIQLVDEKLKGEIEGLLNGMRTLKIS